MRKKERNGPGIATLADSGDPTLASSDDKESVGAVPPTAEGKHETTERVPAKKAARWKRDLVHRFAGESVKRSVRRFKISSRSGIALEGTVEMQRKKIWTPRNKIETRTCED